MRQMTKKFGLGCLLAAFVLASTSVAMGQSYEEQKDKKAQKSHDDKAMKGDRHAGMGKENWEGTCNWRADELLGMDVKDPLGKDLGSIEDLAIDPQSGRIVYAVLSFGGILGMGDKLFAVPFRAFTLKDYETLTLNVSEDKLDKTQGFDKDNWPNMADDRWAKDTHTRYGQTPGWDDAGKPGATDRDRWERPTQIVRASELMGEEVVNNQDEKLGDITDLILDPGQSRVSLAVVSAGGFLGIGEELFAVPWNKLAHRPDEVVLNIDRDTLSKAPHFAKDRFPERGDREYVVTIYRYYRVDPYWTDSMDTEHGRPGKGG